MKIKGYTKLFKDGKFFYFPKQEKKDFLFYVFIALALIRPIGFVSNSPIIDGIGAGTCVSPLPTVFSKPGGIEAFTSSFLIVYSSSSKQSDTIVITSKKFSKMAGPHPFRNAVSLLFGYFPLLSKGNSTSILHYLFYKKKILQEMGVPQSDQYTLINRNVGIDAVKEWTIQIRCDEK